MNDIPLPSPKEIEMLTKELVSRNTITLSKDSTGEYNESLFAVYLKQWFDAQGIRCIVQDLPLGRKNVFAFVRGASTNTIILSGHFDTVPVDAYHQAGFHPFDPDLLAKEQKIDTSKFIAGRGALDMKSGIATAMLLMKCWNDKKAELPGSLLFVATCDEENNSYGILQALDILLALKGKNTDSEIVRPARTLSNGETLNLLGVINVDYTTGRFEGDKEYHVWAGTVGKVLLCVHVQGKQTHVGEPFAGFHAGVLLARIISEIDGNTSLTGGTVPPTLLKMWDDRKEYNVMTPRSASAYVNICTVGKQPMEILDHVKTIVRSNIRAYSDYTDEQYVSYSKAVGIPEQRTAKEVRILYYSEVSKLALQQLGEGEVLKLVTSIKELHGTEDRECSFAIVDALLSRVLPQQPCVVLFYAPPFYPYIRPDKKQWESVLKNVVREVGKKHAISIRVNEYYPYISDMSYLLLEPGISSVAEKMKREYPVWEHSNSLPFEKISDLQLPVVNIGPHGYGAHQISEKADVFYTTKVLPEIILQAALGLLEEK
jgi:arginine utilization protein RocB